MVCYISLYYCCRCSWLSVSPSIHLRIFPFTRKLLIRRFNYGSVCFITSPELSYFLRFVPLVRGGYALAIVVGWLSYNKASGLFVSYLTMLLATVYFSSLIFFVLEHKVNPLVANYGDALWWAFMDVTTVGSNISAITVTGRVLSVVLAALGMMMFPIFTVYVTSLVQKSNEEKKRFYENIQAPSPQPEVKDK